MSPNANQLQRTINFIKQLERAGELPHRWKNVRDAWPSLAVRPKFFVEFGRPDP